MFLSLEAKEVSNVLRQHSAPLRNAIFTAFENAILGCTKEVKFFRELIKELDSRLSQIKISNIKITCRHIEIHQKPIVKTSTGNCELGDLLIVVKYHLQDFTIEAKSIIYQVKLSDYSSKKCSIDQIQLNLLKNWVPFEFGRKRNGGLQQYFIQPQTLEFGSYMLEPRDPVQGDFIPNKAKCYGTCPSAWSVHQEGTRTVDLTSLQYTRGDAQTLLSHLIFEIGEHHNNRPVQQLIDALYRYAGLSPDPPDEFENFWEEMEEDGFAILEINVFQGEE